MALYPPIPKDYQGDSFYYYMAVNGNFKAYRMKPINKLQAPIGEILGKNEHGAVLDTAQDFTNQDLTSNDAEIKPKNKQQLRLEHFRMIAALKAAGRSPYKNKKRKKKRK